MNGMHFDALTRKVGAIDRKTSLKVLGGSLAAAAAARPLASEAGKNKKCNKKCGKVEKACKQYYDEFCKGEPNCLILKTCCPHLKKCKGPRYFDCVMDNTIM